MLVLNESAMVFGWLVGRVPPHKLSASFVIKGTFDLIEGDRAVLASEQAPIEGDRSDPQAAGALRYPADLVPMKPRQELLFVGSAHTPAEQPVFSLPVQLHMGSWSKTLTVVGDRQAARGVPTIVGEPTPFVTMPLGFDRSFGGSSIKENPVGRGHDQTDSGDRGGFVRMPNVLRSDEVALPPQRLSSPANFGPIAPGWPQRMDLARRATYDDRWLREHWPGFPSDFDWRYFNAAPSDQTFPPATIRGNEEITLVHLHPTKARFTFRLPGLRPRWFVDDSTNRASTLREVPLALETIWIDGEAGRVVVLWRGISAVRSKRMKEIRSLLIAAESMEDKPHGIPFYVDLLEKHKTQRRALSVEEGPPPPVLEPLDVNLPRLEPDEWKSAGEAETAEAVALLHEPIPLEHDGAKLAAALLDRAGGGHELLKAPPLDPKTQAAVLAKAFAEYAKEHPEAAARLGPPPTADELDPVKATESFDAEFAAAFGRENDADAAEPDEPDWTRERVASHAAAGGAFDEQNLSGLDLSAMDLSGVSFRAAVLDGANLSRTSLRGADLNSASCSGCRFAAASFDEAILDEADLTGSDLTGASLVRASLANTVVQRARLMRTRFDDARAPGASFVESDLSGATLRRSAFLEADFSRCNFESVHFDTCDLTRASAYGVRAARADFGGSVMRNFRGGEGADFSAARFVGVDASESVWGVSRLDAADFSLATLWRASFVDASLERASFNLARLREARLSDATLMQARLVKADLFRATFEDSRLDGADLRGASLYEAEFLDATLEEADLDLANRKGTKLA